LINSLHLSEKYERHVRKLGPSLCCLNWFIIYIDVYQRQFLSPEAQSLTLPEILNAMVSSQLRISYIYILMLTFQLLERQNLHKDADSLREQFARHVSRFSVLSFQYSSICLQSEDAQARMDKLVSILHGSLSIVLSIWFSHSEKTWLKHERTVD